MIPFLTTSQSLSLNHLSHVVPPSHTETEGLALPSRKYVQETDTLVKALYPEYHEVSRSWWPCDSRGAEGNPRYQGRVTLSPGNLPCPPPSHAGGASMFCEHAAAGLTSISGQLLR